MNEPPTTQLIRAMPVLECADMSRSLAYYKDKLGFAARVWSEPVTFAILQRGVATIALALVENTKPAVARATWAAYLYIRDVDALHAELVAHGVAIPHPPATKDYGCRDFDVDDPDGHILCFGQVLANDPLGPGLGERTGRDIVAKSAGA